MYPETVTEIPVPTLADANEADAEPPKVTFGISPVSTPTKAAVPVKEAAVVALYTLLLAVKPEMVKILVLTVLVGIATVLFVAPSAKVILPPVTLPALIPLGIKT